MVKFVELKRLLQQPQNHLRRLLRLSLLALGLISTGVVQGAIDGACVVNGNIPLTDGQVTDGQATLEDNLVGMGGAAGCDYDGSNGGAIWTTTVLPSRLDAAQYSSRNLDSYPPSASSNTCFYRDALNYYALVPDNSGLSWDDGFPSGTDPIPLSLFQCAGSVLTSDNISSVCTSIPLLLQPDGTCRFSSSSATTTAQNIPIFGSLGLLAMLLSLFLLGNRYRKF